MTRVAIYSRTSTFKQSFTRQTEELSKYAVESNYEIAGIYEEVVSGYRKNSERAVLTKMLSELKENRIDKVLVWEISRLGRTVSEVTQTIEFFNELKVSLFIKMNSLETLIDGKLNPMTSFMINILSSVGEMEKSIVVERMQSGRKSYIKNGGIIGRPRNSKLSTKGYLEKHKDIVKFLKQGQSIRNVAKLTDKGISTVQRVKSII